MKNCPHCGQAMPSPSNPFGRRVSSSGGVGRYGNPGGGPCTPETRRCAEALDYAIRTPGCCHGWNVGLVSEVVPRLWSAGVRWWIDYGTLLGWMTGGEPGGVGPLEGGVGRFYWNDKDSDLCCLAEDRDAVLALIEPLRAKGLNAFRVEPGKHQWDYGDVFKVRLSEINTTSCEVVFWQVRDNGVLDRDTWSHVDRFKGREVPADWVFPTTRGLWEGIEVAIPAQPERLVAHRYGSSWRNLPAARTDGVER